VSYFSIELNILATRDFLLAAVFLCKIFFFRALSILAYTVLRSSAVTTCFFAIFFSKTCNDIFISSLNFLFTILFFADQRIAFLAEDVIGM
jgi:hypothetical protein